MGRAARFLLMAYHWWAGTAGTPAARNILGPDGTHRYIGED